MRHTEAGAWYTLRGKARRPRWRVRLAQWARRLIARLDP